MDAKNMTDSQVMIESAVILMNTLSDDERLEVMSRFCKFCGCDNPDCNCMRDE